MLRSSGFEVTAHPEPEVFLCRKVERPADWYGPVYPAKGPAQEPAR
jgi:tRNA (mo5U34)-methyltransferase